MQNKSNSMNGCDLSRLHVESDSNIPVPKKTATGARKSKGCSKLPELQKYIETVLEASNKCESENVTKLDKIPKEKQAICKGLENKIKEHRLKLDVISNKLKNKRQTRKKYSEAVSRDVEVLHKFFSDFEDPRNWKIRNSDSHLKIERLIEKLYPNPYAIHFENECQNSKTQIFFQKVKKDYLGDDRLYDVFISKVDAETQDNLGNIDLVSADFQIILAEREKKSTNTTLACTFENLNQSVSLNGNNNEESRHSWNASKLIRKTSRRPNIKSSQSVCSVNSRPSTRENCKECRINVRKNIFNKKFIKNNCKKILSKDKKPNAEADYDLGKLEFLNSSDSENSGNFHIKQSQIKNTNCMTNDDFVNEISSEICNEISKTNDLNDLLQIYEVMNKATESFLYLTSVKKSELENRRKENSPASQNQVDPNTKNEVRNTSHVGEENQRLEYILEKENVENRKPKSRRLENIEEESVSFTSESEEIQQKVEDAIFDANQKINEVLEFMNECILKFNSVILPSQAQKNGEETKKESSENVLNDFEEEEEKKLSENILKANEEGKKSEMPSAFQQDSSDQMNIKNLENSLFQTTSKNQSEVVEMTNKNQNARIRCKRKSKHLKSVETENPSVNANEASTSNSDTQPQPNAELVILNNENIVQVAEVLNELGGYAEETQDLNTSKEDLRMIKSVLPLSTKVRRSQPETYKNLKDALEIEEKLLKLNKPKKLVNSSSESQILIKTDPIAGYCQMEKSESLSSGFVFCITPFTQSLTTATVRSTSLKLPEPLSLSLIDFKLWGLKPLSAIKEEPAEKLFIPSEPKYKALKYNYSLKIEILSVLNKKKIIYYASSVCFLSFIGLSKIVKENLIQNSKRQIRVKPLKNEVMNLNTPECSGLCIKNTVAFTTSKSDLLNVTESLTTLKEKPVEALIKAIQETENVLLLQQQNNSENNRLESLCSCRSKEALNDDSVDNEQEKENDKKKIQNLLLRTYRLQKKLQQYLCNMNQSLNSAPFLEKKLDAAVEEKTPLPDELTTDIKTKPEPLPFTTENVTKEVVQTVDRGTTYVSPGEEKDSQTVCEELNELNKNTSEEEKKNENTEDDRSSSCSFKSSNDFSETTEVQNLIHESLNQDTNGKVFKRIFSQMELLKQSVEPENLESQESKFFHDINFKKEETYHNDKLVKINPKNPAKVLKTVFKGRRSSTELTIGLKDVPMKKVRNISVEKTKFSSNHTRISICISKENGLNITENSDNMPLSDEVSSYFLDNMRPSLSMCQTDYTKTDDNVSKSSQSLNERIEDDDDDFKSAGSNVVDSISSTVINLDNTKAKNETVNKVPPAKSFNKHRFDFYRKMDMNVEGVRVKQKPTLSALGRFKELEPLKQALTKLQIRMRSIKRDAALNSNDFYERALKLAKMSAGYCQTCGTRAVIPDDTFGYYKTLLPRRNTQRRSRQFKTTITPSSNFYSFRSSNAEVSSQFCDLDIRGHSSFSLNQTTHSNRTVLRSLLQDMPVLQGNI